MSYCAGIFVGKSKILQVFTKLNFYGIMNWRSKKKYYRTCNVPLL